MRDSTRIPHIVPNAMIRKKKRIVPQAQSTRNIFRMLKQTASLQGPSINSDEFSASQSCSSNSSRLGHIQTTPSSAMTLPVVAPPGPTSFNELGNQQGPTSSREVLPLTPSLSSSLTLPASEQSVATPTSDQSSTEPRFLRIKRFV